MDHNNCRVFSFNLRLLSELAFHSNIARLYSALVFFGLHTNPPWCAALTCFPVVENSVFQLEVILALLPQVGFL